MVKNPRHHGGRGTPAAGKRPLALGEPTRNRETKLVYNYSQL